MIDPTILQDPTIAGTAAELAASLTTLAAKGTASAIAAKVKSFKQMKSADAVRAAYDEVLNEVLQERSEAILIAQAYKDALERVQISDEDIESLNHTIGRILDIFGVTVETDDATAEQLKQRESVEQLKALIAPDTLKTMQLLGFNFKAAIGEPLTKLCAEKISELGNSYHNNKRNTGSGNRPRRK